MATAEANDLITEVTQLPVQPGARCVSLWMLEDPRDVGGRPRARLIESDPALSTQVHPRLGAVPTVLEFGPERLADQHLRSTRDGRRARARDRSGAVDQGPLAARPHGRRVPPLHDPARLAAAATRLSRHAAGSASSRNDAFSARLAGHDWSALGARSGAAPTTQVEPQAADDLGAAFDLADRAARRVRLHRTAKRRRAAARAMRFPADMVEAIDLRGLGFTSGT